MVLFDAERCAADRMIVVCPNTFKQGWVDEIEKHGFQIEATIYESSKKASLRAHGEYGAAPAAHSDHQL